MDKVKSWNVVFTRAQEAGLQQGETAGPGPDEVLCRADISLISTGTELSCYRGVFDPGTNWHAWVSYPFTPGYSMAATVVEAGKRVTQLASGDRVFVWATHRQFFTLRPQKPESGRANKETAQMDESALPWRRIPDNVSGEEAIWGCLAHTTQLGVRRAEVKLGENAVVVGLGLLGQLVVQWLRLCGCRNIIAVDPVTTRLDAARRHGATHCFAGKIEDAGPMVREACGGELADMVFDITGHPAVLSQCVQMVRQLGRVILLGDTPTPSQQNIGPCVVSRSVSVLGIHAMAFPVVPNEWNPWTCEAMNDLFFDMLAQKRMAVADLISHRFSPRDAGEAYASLFTDRSRYMGVAFDWSLL